MTRALIVDDDPNIRQLLAAYFSVHSIASHGVSDGERMREAITRDRYDVVVLDVMLPGEDGMSLCRHIRSVSDMAVVLLTARGDVADKVLGLELGADDYVVKPFDPRELVARIQSILRRMRPAQATAKLGDEVGFEGWHLHRTLRQLTAPNGMIVTLSNSEFRLLWAFLESPRKILGREDLMAAARGRSFEPFDRGIDLLVSRLRQKLGEDSHEPRLIKTVRNSGYMLDVVVTG